jgi:hypothetical protein
MVNLEELKEEINALGSTIKSLKNNASAANKDAITTAVASLLAAKKLYADSNNGIGVDGLPYVDGATTKKGSKNKAKAGDGPTAPSTQEVSKYAVVILNLSFGFRDVGRCYIFAKPLTLVCCFTVETIGTGSQFQRCTEKSCQKSCRRCQTCGIENRIDDPPDYHDDYPK